MNMDNTYAGTFGLGWLHKVNCHQVSFSGQTYGRTGVDKVDVRKKYIFLYFRAGKLPMGTMEYWKL